MIDDGIIKGTFSTIGKHKPSYLRLLTKLGSNKTLTIMQEKSATIRFKTSNNLCCNFE